MTDPKTQSKVACLKWVGYRCRHLMYTEDYWAPKGWDNATIFSKDILVRSVEWVLICFGLMWYIIVLKIPFFKTKKISKSGVCKNKYTELMQTNRYSKANNSPAPPREWQGNIVYVTDNYLWQFDINLVGVGGRQPWYASILREKSKCYSTIPETPGPEPDQTRPERRPHLVA